jgi:hypothetical protein
LTPIVGELCARCVHNEVSRRPAMALRRGFRLSWCVLALLVLAGCSGFGGKLNQAPAVDPNVYPARYKKDIATFLLTNLTDSADFHAASIAEPAIKPVGSSQRYVVCLRFTGHNQVKDKVVVYLAGNIIQFINPTPEQCGNALYQPFRELEVDAPA